MKECPKCGTLYASGWCKACGEGKPGAKAVKEVRDYADEARRAIPAGWPNSSILTDQQWYNVCRFFPGVAAKCSRPVAAVGPENRLHATSGAGMLRGVGQADPKRWAKNILAAHDRGERLLPIQVEFAREALRIKSKAVRNLEAEAEREAIQFEADVPA